MAQANSDDDARDGDVGRGPKDDDGYKSDNDDKDDGGNSNQRT